MTHVIFNTGGSQHLINHHPLTHFHFLHPTTLFACLWNCFLFSREHKLTPPPPPGGGRRRQLSHNPERPNRFWVLFQSPFAVSSLFLPIDRIVAGFWGNHESLFFSSLVDVKVRCGILPVFFGSSLSV